MWNNYKHSKAKFRLHKNQQLQVDYIVTSDGKNTGKNIKKKTAGKILEMQYRNINLASKIAAPLYNHLQY